MEEGVAPAVRMTDDGLMCKRYGKRAFVNRRAAERAMFYWWRSPTDGSKAIHPYECPACGFWHLTSMPQSDGELRRQ